MSIPCIVVVFFVASDVLRLVYGHNSFGEAGMPLQIIALSLVSVSIMRVFGVLLYATGNERANLRILQGYRIKMREEIIGV